MNTKTQGRLPGPCQEVGTVSGCTTSSCYCLCCQRWPRLRAVERVRNHRSEAWKAPAALPGNTETPLFPETQGEALQGAENPDGGALRPAARECLLVSLSHALKHR